MVNHKLRSEPAFQVLLTTRMVEAGIVPITGNTIPLLPGLMSTDKQMMLSLTPDERRRAARKFRKLWRRQEKRLSQELSNGCGTHKWRSKSGVNTRVVLKNMRKMSADKDTGHIEPTTTASKTRVLAVLLALEAAVEKDFRSDSSVR